MDNEKIVDERCSPVADKKLATKLLALLEKCAKLKKIKKGANESTKSLNRNISQIIIIAADARPIEIVLHLPLLCEDKDVAYVFVDGQEKLGRACGVTRPVIAASILDKLPEDVMQEVEKMKISIQQLMTE